MRDIINDRVRAVRVVYHPDKVTIEFRRGSIGSPSRTYTTSHKSSALYRLRRSIVNLDWWGDCYAEVDGWAWYAK